jgi:hypothetical protein
MANAHDYTGNIIDKVAYTMYDTPWFIQWMALPAIFTQKKNQLPPTYSNDLG